MIFLSDKTELEPIFWCFWRFSPFAFFFFWLVQAKTCRSLFSSLKRFSSIGFWMDETLLGSLDLWLSNRITTHSNITADLSFLSYWMRNLHLNLYSQAWDPGVNFCLLRERERERWKFLNRVGSDLLMDDVSEVERDEKCPLQPSLRFQNLDENF